MTSTVVEIDLRVSAKRRFTEPAWQQNHRMRMLLAGTCPGDYIKLRVSRWTIPPVGLSDLLPPGARVQVSADDAQTVREWETLLEAAR